MQSYEFVRKAFSNLGPSTAGGMNRWIGFSLALLFGALFSSSTIPQLDPRSEWVDSVVNTLSLERKVAQLIMIEAYSNRDGAYRHDLHALVTQYQPGGVMFLQGGPVRQAAITNELQELAQVPIFIAQDAEWGLAMRLDSVRPFPWPLTVGATRNDSLAYHMGAQIAQQCKCIGVHINFGPVADVNVNPDNPIIGNRSFGESPERVARLAVLYSRGQQDNGVMACAKHFPGHGDTDQDSHKTLPTVAHSSKELKEIDLKPFKALFDDGVGSIMAAHLNVPALDPSGTPTSLSSKVLTDLVRNEMGYKGLIFTDALNMKGVSDRYKTGELEIKALRSGADVLLMPGDIGKVIEAVVEAVNKGSLSTQLIDEKVRRVLEAKYDYHLHELSPVNVDQIYTDINNAEGALLTRQIARESITIVLNDGNLLPIKDLPKLRPAYVALGDGVYESFGERLNSYVEMPVFRLDKDATEQDRNIVLEQLKEFDPIIIGVHKNTDKFWSSPKVSSSDRSFFELVARDHTTVLDIFANPYALKTFGEALMADALIVSYQNTAESRDLSAQVIFGAEKARGRLPVSPSAAFPVNTGLQTDALGRLKYGIPEEEGIDVRKLGRVDRIMQNAIEKGATPGGQILIAKNGKVVYDKSFGYQTYAKLRPVDESTVYDLASTTKISASVPAIMKLYELGRLDIDEELGTYLPEARGTNKEHMRFREILAHQAGLKPWIPFYTNTIIEGGIRRPELFRDQISDEYPWQVADDLYLRYDYPDTVYKQIYASELLTRKEYRYSDLGYYMLKEVIEGQMTMPIDEWVRDSLFAPLGAYTLGYKPLERMNAERIAPTADDQFFRGQLLRGHVHDPGAALTDGVNGHAGIFGNSTDVAKLMQMYLQMGRYGGCHYFDSTTVVLFTSCQYCEDDNRRGIGFDKPVIDGKGGPTCNCVSLLSFGHSGFTGTLAWADPAEQIIYVFLSNRVNPDDSNRKLIQMDVRTDIQEIIYESLYTYPIIDENYENYEN